MKPLRIIIAAGGTGGHVFPAVALAEEIRERYAHAEILFVGTNRGLEEKVIPSSGFKLTVITMNGLARSFAPLDVLKNILLPFTLFIGIIQSLVVLLQFKPHAVIGCGGYVSGPVVLFAAWMGKKTLVQEQNSRPGRTTLLLAKFVNEVHLNYEDAKQFLRNQSNLIVSGNPLRKGLNRIDKKKAYEIFGLDEKKRTLLVVGGSLGAHSINAVLLNGIDVLSREAGCNVLWQTGKNDFDWIVRRTASDRVKILKFIDNMSAAYSCADLVLCRAGAMTLSELTLMGLPAILVPYPYAADNHQEYNAESFVTRGGGVMIRNSELAERLMPVLIELMTHSEKIDIMSQNSFAMRQTDAAKKIIDRLAVLLENDG